MKIRTQIMNQKKQQSIGLPAKEKELQVLCNDLGIANTADTKVKIISVDGEEKLEKLLANKEVNLDELNYLMKRIGSLDASELDTFYAVAYAEKMETIAELINHTYNTHCYSVVSDFSDPNEIGKKMYLREQGSVNAEEFKTFDGTQYFKKMLSDNPSPTVTPYGIIYQNSNQPRVIYNGKTFPLYWQERNQITLSISSNGEVEYLYLPAEQGEIEKALHRLGVSKIEEVEVQLLEMNLPLEIEDLLYADLKWEVMNQYAKQFSDMRESEIERLAELCSFAKIDSLERLDLLMECMYEFETFPDIHSPMEYGEYLICQSGRFDYDDNLAEYIDFARYGQEKIQQESGIFTEKGYLLYQGCNMEMQNVLHKTVGMEIQEVREQTQLKLYMPLRAITYYEESDYGELQRVDFESEVCASELKEYEEEIRRAMEKRQSSDGKRGMMKYYGTSDSVSAKVARYVFEVEEVQGKLMGVAVLTLNEPLDSYELAKIKADVSGQASDGFGEGLEQCEINCGGKEIYVSLWGADNWGLNTAEELGITVQEKEMSMAME